MKRLKRNFCLLLLLVVGMVGMTGCAKREAVTVSEFNEVMEAAGYEIVDASGQLPGNVAKQISIALKEDYQVEFYVFVDTETAVYSFNKNRDLFEDNNGSYRTQVSKSIGNYSYFCLTCNDKIYLLSRVEDTMIYVVADADYKDDITAMLKKLGY